ncbi:sigma-54 factor interaction domain-containing protein, partial [Cytophagia bacterium CHB2]|nr:sigma-54 factor interaction domain-containing protein [Cytophagia bacterium CHB2]
MGKTRFDTIIGESAAMQRVFELIENVASTDINVLITGESGTGKELIARSIHGRSARRQQAFVPVNCSAFPETLFEAELFGYEKGAFTGATQRKPGLLEFANGGTFFLDEVCELPVSLQAKL